MGAVTVSYHPVSTVSNNDDIPRFVSGPTNDVITIEDCTTTLLFPYVTNMYGFNTGLVITNASDGKGYCTIEYSSGDEDDSDPADLPTLRSRSRVGHSGSDLLSNIAARIPGLYHCNL